MELLHEAGLGLLLSALLAGVATAQDEAREADARPNVLVVLLDDLGYSDLSCYGGEIPTPNIDALAASGLRFTQAYNSARCCPSRAALLTGLYPHQAGIGSFTTERPDPKRGPAYLGHLNDRCVSFAEVLQDAGYATYMVGKWHMGEPGPIARGFDEFYGFTRGYSQDQWDPDRYERLPAGREPELSYEEGGFYATDAFSDYALEFLDQAHETPDRPWLLYLAHSAPHFPVQAPREDKQRFLETYRKGWDVLRGERFARQVASGLATEAWVLPPRELVPVDGEERTAGFSGRPNPAWEDLPADRREDLAHRMALFAAMVSHVDAGMGRIVDFLERTEQLDDTLILLLSDNGACYEWGPHGFDGFDQRVPERPHTTDEELAGMGGPGTWLAYGSAWAHLGNTPLAMYKHFTHEGGICTPLIVHWPHGVAEPDRWVRTPVMVQDVLPTLCEVAGSSYPEQLGGRDLLPVEGTSLVPLLRGGELGERTLFFEHQGARGVRQGRWKAVWSKREPHEVAWELYDLAGDRCELRDLAAERPERAEALSAAWLDWAARVKVYPFFEER
jgi:arylsulfatase